VVADGGGAAAGALAPLPWERTAVGSRGVARRRLRLRSGSLAGAWARFGPAIVAYVATRVALVVAMALNAALRPLPLVHAVHWDGAWLSQIAHWDGAWYSLLALTGYPSHTVAGQSTLGFFPLYPLVTRSLAYPVAWFTGQPLAWAIPVAGAALSAVGGLVCVMLVQELATDWWGRDSGRRAAVFFCLFPGSVVFSMVYAEGLMLPLAAGCLLALQRRRWVLAGTLAGLATACEPEALVLVPVCALGAVRELRRRGWRELRRWGWREPAALRSLAAPLLSTVGVGGFAVYLWAWTGTPLATAQAQHTGWGETTDGLALFHMVRHLVDQISFSHFNHPTIDMNLVSGLIGALLLIALWVLLLRARKSVPAEALLWTLGISWLAVTSEFVPPNPRLLITAFPAVLVVGRYVKGKRYAALATFTGVALVGLSALTFVGSTLRP
jgi:hypothetical protein